MNLYLDTAGPKTQIALHENEILDRLISNDENQNEINDNLDLVVSNLLKRNRTSPQTVENLIVILGPGSYTGSRMGIAFAKGYTQFTNTKLFGISALDVAASSINGAKSIAIPSISDLHYYKEFNNTEGFYSKPEDGEIVNNEKLSKETKIVEHPAIEQTIRYFEMFQSKLKESDPVKLTPIYLKEPNITKPKTK